MGSKLLSASLERVGEEDFAGLLFSREDSRLAARVFISWLKSNNGRCSKEDMSRFSYELAAGIDGARLARTNFYKTILARFIELGLVCEKLVYDPSRRKAVKAYEVIIQPLPSRRPLAPSLLYLAHVISEKWNAEFSPTGEVNQA
jgi:hypothetical protein